MNAAPGVEQRFANPAARYGRRRAPGGRGVKQHRTPRDGHPGKVLPGVVFIATVSKGGWGIKRGSRCRISCPL